MSASSKSISINTKIKSVSFNGKTIITKSRSLIVFICILIIRKRMNPDVYSVGIEELRDNLPSVHGKQMQRYIDALADIHFPIGFESKTRGRYWLAAPLDQVQFDVDEAELMLFVSERNDMNPHTLHFVAAFNPEMSLRFPLERRLTPRFSMNLVDPALTSIGRLVSADLQFHDGNLDNHVDHAYEILRNEIKSATPEFKALALLKLARVCLRLNRYGEAQEALRILRTMVRSGEVVAGNFEDKIHLEMTKLRFDQGRVEEARAIFEKIDLTACRDDWLRCSYNRLSALLLWNKIVTEYEKASAFANQIGNDTTLDALATVVGLHKRSLQLSMSINDYQAMQLGCLDIGHVYLDAYRMRCSMPDQEQLLGQGVNWISQCEHICSKFGVGMDSVRSKILLMSVAVESDMAMNDLNQRTGGLFRNFANFDAMADFTLSEARRIGNSLELASVLTILASLAKSRGDVGNFAQFQQEAMDIYKKQNRPELCRQLKKRFETTKFLPLI